MSLVMADSVEKVLSSVLTNFLRASGALAVLGRGGPLRPEQIHPVATCSKNASPPEVGDQFAFARSLLRLHFRLFQQNRPETDLPRCRQFGRYRGKADMAVACADFRF